MDSRGGEWQFGWEEEAVTDSQVLAKIMEIAKSKVSLGEKRSEVDREINQYKADLPNLAAAAGPADKSQESLRKNLNAAARNNRVPDEERNIFTYASALLTGEQGRAQRKASRDRV